MIDPSNLDSSELSKLRKQEDRLDDCLDDWRHPLLQQKSLLTALNACHGYVFTTRNVKSCYDVRFNDIPLYAIKNLLTTIFLHIVEYVYFFKKKVTSGRPDG